MNKAYRLVWSARLGSFVAVPEFACSRGKGGELLLVAATALSVLCMTPAAAAGVVAAGTTNTSVSTGSVPVVGIAAANTAGLSHNQYKEFSVNGNGLVFNNNAAAGAVASQLAGTVAKNANLTTGAAKLILNEVVVANRSALEGYMEVAGSRASVVVANPWGITCNGCGFINTDRATLSTGVPVLAGDGSLERLSVSAGDILINGAGLKGQNTDILNLVARSVVVDGRIDANDLQIVAGSNNYNYAQRSATAIAASTTAPWQAIDSTALGGMYAQKIALIATEAGVGVHMLGNAAASASDFTLTAAGTIDLQSRSISAKRNLAVTSSDASIFVPRANATLSAGESLSLKASDKVESYGSVESQGSMNLTAGSSVRNLGTLKASGVLGVKSGFLNNQGYIGSGEGFKLDLSYDLTNGSASNYSARIESTQDRGNSTNASSISAGENVVNYGAIHTADDLSIVAGSVKNQGTGGITSGRALNLTASNAIENRGALYSGDRGLKLQAPTITNFTGGTIEAVTGISSKSSVFNNYSVIRANTIAVTTDASFYNGLETPVTAVLDKSKIVASPASEPKTQIDFWQETGCSACNERTLFQDAVTYREQYSSALPAVKPQMLALGTLTLDYGKGTATNYAGVISGDLVSITGSGAFTNQDVTLLEITYYRRALDYKQNGWAWRNASHAYLAATTAIPLTNANLSDAERKQLATYASVEDALAHSALFEKNRIAYSSTGAGVYANTLKVSAGQVKNIGAPFAYGDSRLAQGGFSITLPTNPNGHYILSGNPKSRYLVVTNPDFLSTAARAKADELEKMMGYNPDDQLLRVGDSGYEESLIREQLISAGASQLLAGNDAELINRLRENASREAGIQEHVYRQTLTRGEELTPEQIKNLRFDIVWMVKTKVKTKDGEKTVLAPRVYLSAATRAMLQGGAALAAKNTTINAASVTNSGASITGAQTLTIKTTGNIANESGTISGGKVNLAAGGDVVNKTLTQAQGNSRTFNTTLGKTGRIEATTGSLEISSGRRIRVQGAEIKSARDTTLNAVGGVAFESIESTTTTSASDTNSAQNKKSKKNASVINKNTATDVNNIRSLLAVGGDLRVISDADFTLKGSDVKVGGDVYLEAKGDANILAVQNQTTRHSESSTVGRGVNGARWGRWKRTVDETRKTNSASTFLNEGNSTLELGGKFFMVGSKMKAAEDLSLHAGKGVSIVDGKNELERKTSEQTKSLFKRGGGTPPAAPAGQPVASGQSGDGQASGKAGTSGKVSDKSEYAWYEMANEEQDEKERRSVASELESGGNLYIDTDGDTYIRGSKLTSAEDTELYTKNLDVAPGINTLEKVIKKDRLAIGSLANGNTEGSTQAQLQGRGSNGGGAMNGDAGAKGRVEGALMLGFMKDTEEERESAQTHSQSVLTSGNNMTLEAEEAAHLSAVLIETGGDLGLVAQDIFNTAVQDTRHTSTTINRNLFGLIYQGIGTGEATLGFGGQVGIGMSGEATGNIAGSLGGIAGLRHMHEQQKLTTGTVTNLTNHWTAVGDIVRTATDTLFDQATQMNSGQNIVQNADTIIDQAVYDSTKTTFDNKLYDTSFGLYLGMKGDAGFTANATLFGPSGVNAKPDGSAGFGFQGNFRRESEQREDQIRNALTSNYSAEDQIVSNSTGMSHFEGTRFFSGDDTELHGGSMGMTTVQDTRSSSTHRQGTDAQLTVITLGTQGVTSDLGHKDSREQTRSTNERGGGVQSDGNIRITSDSDLILKGTEIDGGGTTTIDAPGKVEFDVARSTSDSSKQTFNGSGKLKFGSGSGSGSGKFGVAYGKKTASTTDEKPATIAGKDGVAVTAGKEASFKGTQFTSQDGKVAIESGGPVRLLEATRTEKRTALGVGAGYKGKASLAGPAGGKPTTSGATPPPPTPERSGAARPANRATPQPKSPGPGNGTRKPDNGNASPNDAAPLAAPPTMGINGYHRKSSTTTSTAPSIDARETSIKGKSVQDQGTKTKGKTVIDGPVEKLKQTNKQSVKGGELTLGSPTKRVD